MTESATVTTFLAVWGAVLSTVLGVLRLREIWLDRPRLKITLQSGMRGYPRSPLGGGDLLIISVANAGRRPTTVELVSLLLPRGSVSRYTAFVKDAATFTYPVELKENQGHSFIANEDDIKAKHPLTKPSRYVIRVDTVPGRVYWSHGPLARRWKSRRWRVGS